MTNLLRQWAGNILRPDIRARELVFHATPENIVIDGVFKGMRYLPPSERKRSTAKSYMSRLLGTYELELRDAVIDLCKRPNDVIFNIGAAEGYYAVGLALRCPQAKVVAFEAEDRTLLKQMIEMNGVQDRVTSYGYCDVAALNEQLKHAAHPAIVIDVEGAERELLDPVTIPKLRSAIILVELHDFIDPTIPDLLRNRFAETHLIQEISEQERTLADFPVSISLANRWIPEMYILRLLEEWRPRGMKWYYMIPKSAAP